MKKGVIVLSVVVALFGVASAVLGIIAEATKLAANDIVISRSGCVYRDNPAYALGLVAALLLLVAQITASAAAGCCGCCKPPGDGFSRSKRSRSKITVGAVLSVVSWIVALIAIRFFLQGAVGNSPMTRGTREGQSCYYLRNGVFMMGSIMSIVATVLAIISYITLCAAAAAPTMNTVTLGETKHDGIAMEQPAAAQPHAQAV